MAKTRLGEEAESCILLDLAPQIGKWAERTKLSVEEVESCVAYLWKARKQTKEQSWQDYLSANELGPYGGR